MLDRAQLLNGKRALIVGADSGIGLATVEAFVAAGANVVFTGLNDKVGAENAASLAAGADRKVWFLHSDVRHEKEFSSVIAAAVEHLGGLDIAVNNAGVEGPSAPIHQVETDDFDQIMAINVRGVFLGMKYQIPHMLEAGGTIINLASTASTKPVPNGSGYTASKHAVAGLTKAAALDLSATGIRVNAIAPGPVDTPLLSRLITRQKRDMQAVRGRLPVGRVAEAAEVGGVIAWMASEEASFMTGSILYLDGGLTIL